MTNQQIVEDLLKAVVRVGSKATSDNYIILVLNTVVRDLRREYEAFSYVGRGTTSNLGSARKINVDPEINSVDKESFEESLSLFLERILTLTGLDNNDSFRAILRAEMGKDLVGSIKRLGVEIS